MIRRFGLYVEVIIFVAVFCHIMVTLTYISRDGLANTNKNLSGFYAEPEDSLDVIILGTSSTFSAIAPMEIWGENGITSYDFCTNMLYEDSFKYAVREIVKTQSPSLLIVDIAPFMYGHFANNTDEEYIRRYNTDGYKISKNRIDLINAVVPDKRDRIYFYFDFLYYHTNDYYRTWNRYWGYHIVEKGWNDLPVQVVFDVSQEIPHSFEDYELPEEEKLLLDDFLEELNNYNFKVLFIAEPYFLNKKAEKGDQRCCWIQNYLENKGYQFLNMREHREEIEMNPETDYSLDYNHYHMGSAKKISHYLGNYIQEHYQIEDKRNDHTYLSDLWNEDYEKWQEEFVKNVQK